MLIYLVMFGLGFFLASIIDLFRVYALKRQLAKVARNQNLNHMYTNGVEYAIYQIEKFLEY